MTVPTVTATAKPVHSTAIESSDWDGPAAVAAMPNEEATLWYAHAWRDPDGDPNEKETYKFPHHRTRGGPANLPACRNILARVSQANIPSDEMDAVRRHAQAHLDDAENGEDSLKHEQLHMKIARPMAQLRQGRNDWYRIENRQNVEDTTDVFIYDEISWFGLSANDFIQALRDIKTSTIELHMNTPGGNVFDAIAIYNALLNHEATVNVTIDSLAASAGAFIAQAGDNVKITRNGTMMIHDAQGLSIGNANDMRDMASFLDKMSDNIADIFATRTGTPVDVWREAMQAETWFSAEEAVAAKLADSIVTREDTEDEPDNSWDLTVFRFPGRDRAPEPSARLTSPEALSSEWFFTENIKDIFK